MPTVSGYITTSSQGGNDVAWSDLANADGAPDASVATCDTGGEVPNNIQFTHAITVPSGATLTACRFVITWADTASATNEIDATIRLNGQTLVDMNAPPPLGSLDADTLAVTTRIANLTEANINAGTGTFEWSAVDGEAVFAVDAIQIQVDYTGGRRSSRTFLFKEMVKSPIVRQC